MCFLTYICNYLFLFHTLFYYKNGDRVFHFMEVLLYQACENFPELLYLLYLRLKLSGHLNKTVKNTNSEQTCMCFLTYICNYLFLFHTLFYYKNGDRVFHLMEVLLYQACENGLTLGQALQVCCSVVQSFLSNWCQHCATKT